MSVIFLSIALLANQQALAHSDHVHAAITETQAMSVAIDLAKKISVKDAGLDIGKLPPSWASVLKEDIGIHKKGRAYYIVFVENKDEKKALYVLMSSNGEVYDANFSGVFEGID